jgi:hypothetical protein
MTKFSASDSIEGLKNPDSSHQEYLHMMQQYFMQTTHMMSVELLLKPLFLELRNFDINAR